MIPNTYYGVSSQQVSQLPIQISQIEGYFSGAAPAWLQLFDSCIAPGAGAVPLWEMPLNATAQFQETLQVARLNLCEGIFIGVSSTEGTYTASASLMDITVWTDVTVLATNVVGDKTTAVAIKQVWSRLTTNKKLQGLIITELSGLTVYVYISAANATDSLEGSIGYLFTLAPNATRRVYFGLNNGLQPLFNDVNNVLGNGVVLYTGCTIMLSNVQIQNGGLPTMAGNCTVLAITN